MKTFRNRPLWRKDLRRLLANLGYGYPLLIDPDKLTVEVPPESIDYQPPAFPVARDGATYWLGKTAAGEYRVCRFGFPNFKVEQGKDPVPFGRLAFQRQWTMLLDVAGDVWLSGQPQGPFRRLRTVYPGGDRPRWQDLRIFAGRNQAMLVYDARNDRLFEVALPPDAELGAALRASPAQPRELSPIGAQ